MAIGHKVAGGKLAIGHTVAAIWSGRKVTVSFRADYVKHSEKWSQSRGDLVSFSLVKLLEKSYNIWSASDFIIIKLMRLYVDWCEA